MVDAHTERDRGNNDRNVSPHPRLLNAAALLLLCDTSRRFGNVSSDIKGLASVEGLREGGPREGRGPYPDENRY